MQSKSVRFLAPMALFGITACTAPPAETDLTRVGDLAVAMKGAQTFGLHPNARYVNPRPGDFAFDIRSSMDGAISKVFIDAGYSNTDHSRADRVIAYAIGTHEHMRDSSVQEFFGITPKPDVRPSTFRGALVIAILDPHSNVVFRGTASRPVQEAPMRDAERQRKRILKAVSDLLVDLPQR